MNYKCSSIVKSRRALTKKGLDVYGELTNLLKLGVNSRIPVIQWY
jgi:hypothetical protein